MLKSSNLRITGRHTCYKVLENVSENVYKMLYKDFLGEFYEVILG